jgi:cytochrome c556
MHRKILILAASLMLILAPSVGMTSEANELKEIMQGLRNNLVDISDGLLTDDFEKIAHGADAIAGHPQIPPGQVKLVAAELGSEMAAFKQLDTLVHDLSLEIGAAATTHDRDDAISGYQRLLDGCLACHSTYKERVAAVLSRTPGAE